MTTVTELTELTEEQIAHYYRKGYLVVRGLLTEPNIVAPVRDLLGSEPRVFCGMLDHDPLRMPARELAALRA